MDPFVKPARGVEEEVPVDDETDDTGGDSGEKDWFKPVFRAGIEVLVEEL